MSVEQHQRPGCRWYGPLARADAQSMSGRDDHGLTPVNICSEAAAADVSVLTFSSCHSFVGNCKQQCN